MRSENVSSERYGDSIVYRFKVYDDHGETVKIHDGFTEDGEPKIVDRIFAVQVQDGCCVKKAVTEFLTNLKKTLSAEATPETPEITV